MKLREQLTKLDLMDRGTNAKDVLEGRAYRLQHSWVGVINRSQADINKNVDMRAARQKERDYFKTSPEYRHLAGRMGSEYLAKILSKHLEDVIKVRIPNIYSLTNKTIVEPEAKKKLGREKISHMHFLFSRLSIGEKCNGHAGGLRRYRGVTKMLVGGVALMQIICQERLHSVIFMHLPQ
jgi:hypothetical protein